MEEATHGLYRPPLRIGRQRHSSMDDLVECSNGGGGRPSIGAVKRDKERPADLARRICRCRIKTPSAHHAMHCMHACVDRRFDPRHWPVTRLVVDSAGGRSRPSAGIMLSPSGRSASSQHVHRLLLGYIPRRSRWLPPLTLLCSAASSLCSRYGMSSGNPAYRGNDISWRTLSLVSAHKQDPW